MRAFIWILMLMLMGAAGCTRWGKPSRSRLSTQPPVAWIAVDGGLPDDGRAERLERIAIGLATIAAIRPARVRVLGSPSVAAYAWPSRDVFVSAGLVDLLSDDQLTAALAHEMGHLINDGYIDTPAGLRGIGRGGTEARADEAGVQLLGGGWLPRSHMISMLDRVAAASSTSPHVARSLRRRAEALRRRQVPDQRSMHVIEPPGP